MGKFSGQDRGPGRVNRVQRELRREIAEERAARRLRASTFPAGSIPPEALASPSAAGFASLTTSNFAVPTAGATLLSSAVTVPAMMTGCVVSLTGRAYAANTTATDDYLLARVEVDSTQGTALPVHCEPTGSPGAAAVNVATLTTVLTGLTPGGTFDVRLWARTSTADWSATTANTADLSGTLAWFAT